MAVSTAALIVKNGRYLLVRRPEGGDLGELWELPGGKVDPGESPQTALARELDEELGIPAEVGALVERASFEHAHQQFELLAFEVKTVLDSLTLREHTDLCWRDTHGALELDLAPSDRALLEKIAANQDRLRGGADERTGA